MNKGYSGRILHVDLTNGSVKTKPLDSGLAKAFIGDVGISLRLAYDLIKPGMEPLSPENPIIISAGPLVGTQLGTRFSILCKYPLTGAIAFGSAGMGIGAKLKWAGYDNVVITGHAPKPVYLRIWDDEVEICDASALWGKDTYETTDALWQKLGRLYSVIAIGQTGENLVPLSVCMVDKTSSIGKGGLPAVMGSKNLKAVVVRGSKPVQIADPERFKKISDKVWEAYSADPGLKKWMKVGKMWFFSFWAPRVTIKNQTEVFSTDRLKELYGEDVYFKYIMGDRIGCTGCPYPCKDLVTVGKGADYAGLTTNISSMSGRVRNMAIQAAGGCTFGQLVKLMDVANRWGVNSHNFAPVMMLAVELYEKGIITNKDTEGLVLKSDFETTLALMEKVTFRQGIGDVLADGTPGIIERFGKKCEKYATHIKGLDAQLDPRLFDFDMMGFCQVTNPEGGSLEPAHVGSNWYPSNPKGFSLEPVKEFCQRVGLSKEATDRIFGDMPLGCYNTARITPCTEDFYIMLTSLGICEYRTEYMDWPTFAELYSSATGIEVTADEMRQTAEKIWNLFKGINVREGFDRKDDRFPERWLQLLRDANGTELPLCTCEGRPVSKETFSQMLDEYYNERGWDIKTGKPTKAKLNELGLTDVARDIYG